MAQTLANVELLLIGVATAGYAVAWVFYLLSLRLKVEKYGVTANAITWIALALHASSLTVRGFRAGHLPIFNAYEFLSLFAGGVILFHLLLERFSGRKDLGSRCFPLRLPY